MDTIEESGGTYFYAGRYNLSASELFFIIFCEETANQLGIDDFAAIVAIYSGRNISKTRAKPAELLKTPPMLPEEQGEYLVWLPFHGESNFHR